MDFDDGDRDAPGISRVDRYILVVTPRLPFVEWVRRLQERRGVRNGETRYSLQEAQTQGVTTFLVPFFFDPRRVIPWVTADSELIFEIVLQGMEPDSRLWPTQRTPEVFEEWFDLRLLDAPIDLVDGPVYLDDLTNDERDRRIRELQRGTDISGST